jgi:ribonuclease R
MIAANVAAAETLERARSPVIYRIHDVPGREKLIALREFLTSLSMSFSKSDAVRPSHFNQVLRKAKTADKSEQVSEMVLRSQAQAEYSVENVGHFGLNLDRYAHFTSPIRRYADLIVHRALISALGLGKDGLSPSEIERLPSIAEHISTTERRAMSAERETSDRLLAQFMASHIGARFEGKIAGVTRSGLFVRLSDTGADGFIPASTLGSDYYHHVEEEQAMVGERTGERFRLGDSVTVRLLEAAPMAGALRFEILSEGERGKPLGRRPQKSRGNFSRGKRRKR